MDLKDALAKPYYWTAFVFDGIHPDDLHCTHKFLGDQPAALSPVIFHIIDMHFKHGEKLHKFKERFDCEEFFGPNKDVRVLVPHSPYLRQFHPHLRSLLDNFRKDDFPDFRPHITTTFKHVDMLFTGYVLMRGKEIVNYWEAS